MIIDYHIKPEDLKGKLDRFWNLSGEKIQRIESEYNWELGTPVFTVNGKYKSHGRTEWTQGFQYGSAILQFDATGDETFLKIGRDNTVDQMAQHISHVGCHDHGFNNISTYGNLHRLLKEGRLPQNEWENNYYKIALKASGAIQANRWSKTCNGGYINSFNGPQSLFIDTIRSCRSLMIAHKLGNFLQSENGIHISLLKRGIEHLITTAKYLVYYDEDRDIYDEWGRTSQVAIFNPIDGRYRCSNSQQGYSGYSTWMRGLAWAMLGFSEELEFLDTLPCEEFKENKNKEHVISNLIRAAEATCDFYIDHTAIDGIPYWDSGAPGLIHLKDYLNRPADPYNHFEPVDSSAAAIGAQGLLRLGHYLNLMERTEEGTRFWQAGLTIVSRLLDSPYLSVDPEHQGILLHSVYHRPNGYDHIPEGHKIPCNESGMWGDYHMRESALYLSKIISNETYYTFFNGII